MKQLKIALIVFSLFLLPSFSFANESDLVEQTQNGWIEIEVGNTALGYKSSGVLNIKADQPLNLHVRAYHSAGVKYFEFQITVYAKDGSVAKQIARSAYQYHRYDEQPVGGHGNWWQQRTFDQNVSAVTVRAKAILLNDEELISDPVRVIIDPPDCNAPR